MIFSKRSISKKIRLILIGTLLMVFTVLQVKSPEISNAAVSGKFTAPKEVSSIFERACFDCHSNETSLEWYDKIAPFSYVIAADVKEARKRLNFSTWDSLSKADQETKIWYIVNMIDAGKMPLPAYLTTHPSARVTKKELATLKKYVNGLSEKNHGAGDTALIKQIKPVTSAPNHASRRTYPKSVNGIRYFDDYKNWKVISSTNRFDNGTMRLIYGNDIAVNALKDGHIKPWPNGAIIVKVVWNSQHEDPEGNVSPGNFNNVQIMIRDGKKFKDTEGWGFARFNGLDLEPFGKTVSFATTCINCHRLVPENGFVFDIPTKK